MTTMIFAVIIMIIIFIITIIIIQGQQSIDQTKVKSWGRGGVGGWWWIAVAAAARPSRLVDTRGSPCLPEIWPPLLTRQLHPLHMCWRQSRLCATWLLGKITPWFGVERNFEAYVVTVWGVVMVVVVWLGVGGETSIASGVSLLPVPPTHPALPSLC